MKLLIIMLTTCLMQVSAASFAQRLTLVKQNVSLKEVFREIRQQTGYNVLWPSEKLDAGKMVDADFRHKELTEVLDELLKGQSLSYSIDKKTVRIAYKEPSFLDRVVDAFNLPINVSGVVLDEKGTPLAGATVRVKGLKISVVTDKDGKFYLPGVDDKAVLLVSYVGYKELEVLPKTELQVHLELLNKDLEEVVIAYGKTTRQALTGAVTVISGDQIASQPNRSFDKSLQGLVPGLLVTNGTGQPGGGVSNMVLRGISSGSDGLKGSTARNPLIVIDGVPTTQDNMQYNISSVVTPVTNPLAQINPNDIESISVLKDASAIALYGSQASNGVILVTTKRGKQGPSTVSVNQQVDVSYNPKTGMKMLDQQGYLRLLYETYKTSLPAYTDQDILNDLITKFPYQGSGTNISFYPAPDWNAAVFNDGAITSSTNIGISGGSERSNHYINAEYTTQDGAVKASGYDRMSLRLNYDLRPRSFIKLSNSTNLSYNIQDIVNPTEGFGSFGGATVLSPLNPIRYADGNFVLNYPWGIVARSSSPLQNPVASAEYNVNRLRAYRGLTNFKASVDFLKWFTISSDLGVDFMLSENYEKSDPRLRLVVGSGSGRISEYTDKRANIISTNMLSFTKTFGVDHQVNALIAQEARTMTTKTGYALATGNEASLPYYDEINSPGYMVSFIATTNKQTLLSQFGQAQYGYQNKYFASGSFRRDGSSLFGANEQWAKFWSLGAGWVISNEGFMKKWSDYVSYLKLRGSLGVAGNSANVTKLNKSTLLTEDRLNGELAVYSTTTPGNPYIKWEETYTWDIGLETRFWKDRISFSADVYRKFTDNLIYTSNIGFYTGFATVRDNIGDMNNDGIELSLNGDVIRYQSFKWNSGLTWSGNRNKLTKAYINLERTAASNLANEVGRNYNSYYIPVWLGANPENGAPQWKDKNGNPTSNYSLAQREFIGKPQPDGFGTMTNRFSWKEVDLSFQLYYQYGFKVYDEQRSYLLSDGVYSYLNTPVEASNRWMKPGDISDQPIRKLNNTDQGNLPSTRNLFNGDFLKLQQVSLSYRLPEVYANRLKVKGMRFFVQGFNLYQWSLSKSSNPDNATVSGNMSFSYPQSRAYSLGLNVTF